MSSERENPLWSLQIREAYLPRACSFAFVNPAVL